jgi:hypothetical protein
MSIETALLSWLLLQPVHKTDIGEPDRFSRMSQIAEAIAVVSAGNRLMAASLAIVAREESAFRRDVQEGSCPAHLCDRGAARGLPQLHRPPVVPVSVWLGWAGESYQNTLAAFSQAANMLRAGRHKCGDIDGAISYYATGGHCTAYTGAKRRADMIRQLAGRL